MFLVCVWRGDAAQAERLELAEEMMQGDDMIPETQHILIYGVSVSADDWMKINGPIQNP